AGVRQGLNVLSGPIHAWAPVAVSEIGVQVGRAASRSAMVPAGSSSAWASGLASSYEVDGTNGAVDADTDILGGAFGVNTGLADGLNVGVFAGYATSDGGDAVGGQVETNGWFFGGRFATALAPSLTLSGSAGYLSQDVETDRSI